MTWNPRRSLVYVEANYEIREPVRDAEPGTIDAQRTVFLRQGTHVSSYSSASNEIHPYVVHLYFRNTPPAEETCEPEPTTVLIRLMPDYVSYFAQPRSHLSYTISQSYFVCI